MGGTVTGTATGSLDAFFAGFFPRAGVICSATPEVRGTRALLPGSDPRELQDVDVAVVRAAGFRLARYAALMTGPCATADIDGVLMRGARGIRSLMVVPIAGARQDGQAASLHPMKPSLESP